MDRYRLHVAAQSVTTVGLFAIGVGLALVYGATDLYAIAFFLVGGLWLARTAGPYLFPETIPRPDVGKRRLLLDAVILVSVALSLVLVVVQI